MKELLIASSHPLPVNLFCNSTGLLPLSIEFFIALLQCLRLRWRDEQDSLNLIGRALPFDSHSDFAGSVPNAHHRSFKAAVDERV